MKQLAKVNCIVKGQNIKFIEGANKGQNGEILKISGYISRWGCVFTIHTNDNKIVEYPSKYFVFTNKEIQEFWESDECDDFEIEE